jgi:hypothetical protein
MRTERPTEAERDAVRSALLGVANDLWVGADHPLARALFVTRAGLVARALVRADRHRHGLTYADIGTAFGITAQSAYHRFALHASPCT